MVRYCNTKLNCTSHRNSIVAQVKPHFYSKGRSSILMSVERKILLTLPHEAIIQQIAQRSAELSRALLRNTASTN